MDQEPKQIQEKDLEQPEIIEEGQEQKPEEMQAEEENVQEKGEELSNKQYVDEVKIGGETLFTITPEMQNQSNNLVYRQRKSRWGERKIKRSKIQEDAVFNPLEALYSGNSLLPITQYGQAELDVKLSLYSDGKRRKSKWHHEIQKTFTPPMINYISPNISVDEVQYLIRLYRLDELTAKINDFTPDDADIRSPSPQPIYDKDGRRINTREVRKRDTLHRERIGLIQDCIKMRNGFVPPDDYKPLKKYKKIYLTETAINDAKANYIGKIIGPQGSTQKLIQKRSGCKIGVRGRGANKHQKDIFENYQPLHIIVVADTDQNLDKGVNEVHNILNGEQDDELQEMLRELEGRIVLGKLDDNYCDNCQSQGHRTWACPFEMKNKINVKCSICGQNSHPTSDCPERGAYLKNQQANKISMLLESQLHQFKSDLNNENKNRGQLKFITDEKKDLLAIAGDKSRKPMDKKDIPGQKKKTQALPVFAPQTDDIPKFEDD